MKKNLAVLAVLLTVSCATSNGRDAAVSDSGPAAEAASQTPAIGMAAPRSTTAVVIESLPSEGDVYVDGQFIGKAPVTLRLTEGTHAVVVNHAGFESWKQDMVVADSPTQLLATLVTK